MTRDARAVGACRMWADDWGGLAGVPEPSPSQIIRAIAHTGWAGHRRSLSEVYTVRMSGTWIHLARPAQVTVHPNGNGKSGYGSTEMRNAERAERLAKRYQRFVQYMREARHGWEKVGDVYYADNSIERVERSRLTGETRRRQIMAPGGDVCF